MNYCEHEFIDVYDIAETIPTGVIDSAANYKAAPDESQVLQAGKIVTKKYITSYCKRCGMKVGDLVIVNKEERVKVSDAISGLEVSTE